MNLISYYVDVMKVISLALRWHDAEVSGYGGW